MPAVIALIGAVLAVAAWLPAPACLKQHIAPAVTTARGPSSNSSSVAATCFRPRVMNSTWEATDLRSVREGGRVPCASWSSMRCSGA